MRRRDFIAGLGGAAAWSLGARTQQADRMRRIGWLTFATENDPLSQGSVAVFREALGKLGWIEGHNLRIDYRFAGIETNRVNEAAAELIGFGPDAITVTGTQALWAAQRQPQGIRIVFVAVADPVASGLVGSALSTLRLAASGCSFSRRRHRTLPGTRSSSNRNQLRNRAFIAALGSVAARANKTKRFPVWRTIRHRGGKNQPGKRTCNLQR
jgi:hypothetical protein